MRRSASSKIAIPDPLSVHPVYEFRPLPDFFRGGFRRFADGAWIDDDGEYDIAFIGSAPFDNICLYVELPYQENILWSWTTGHWSGFERKHPRGNAWHYMLREGALEWGGDWGRGLHPNTLAGEAGMSKICAEQSAANGRHVAFEIEDKHIAAGLVRARQTKEIVKAPETPVCMYCDPA